MVQLCEGLTAPMSNGPVSHRNHFIKIVLQAISNYKQSITLNDLEVPNRRGDCETIDA